MKNHQSKLWVLAILVGSLIIAYWMVNNRPERAGRKPPEVVMSVETQRVSMGDFPVKINSWGSVQPRTRGKLTAQVSGQLLDVSPRFKTGAFVEEGELLLQIDQRDYKTAHLLAESALADAQFKLEDEQARSAQAKKDWKRLNPGVKPDPLAIRQPQLRAAKAGLVSAQAQLEKTALDLERTQILAPYPARIVSTQADKGEVISSNSVLAEIIATDIYEVVLPVSGESMSFIVLPDSETAAFPHVDFYAEFGQLTQKWSGSIRRMGAEIDPKSLQWHLVAIVDQASQSQQLPLQFGQFLQAEIQGKILKNTIQIPSKTVYRQNQVPVLKDGRLQWRTVEVLWSDENRAVIQSGLEAGEEIVMTPVGALLSGTKLKILGQTGKKQPDRKNKPKLPSSSVAG